MEQPVWGETVPVPGRAKVPVESAGKGTCILHAVHQLQPLFPVFFFTFSAAPSTSPSAASVACSTEGSTCSVVLFTWSSAALPVLPAVPLQPLAAASFLTSAALPALGLSLQPLPAAWALGRLTPPPPIRLAIPRPASNVFKSLFFMLSSWLSPE